MCVDEDNYRPESDFRVYRQTFPAFNFTRFGLASVIDNIAERVVDKITVTNDATSTQSAGITINETASKSSGAPNSPSP